MIKPCCHIYPSNAHGATDLSLAQLFPTPSQKAPGFAVSTVLGPPAKLPQKMTSLRRWHGAVFDETMLIALGYGYTATHSNSRYQPW